MDDLRERVARALAEADGIPICSDASYRLSSYGIRADIALSATPIEALQQRVERLEDLLRQCDGGTHDQDCKVHCGLPCNCLHDEVVAVLGDDVG